MALGSGSSFSTDCWTRRRGFPSSEKLLKVGKASLISTSTHHRSPPPNQDWPRLPSSVGRAFFFSFVEGIGGGDPTFRSLPTNSKQTRQSSPDGFPRDAFVGYPFLEGSLCSHLKRPQATVVAELPRGAVEHPPQPLGTLLIEGGASSLGARGTSFQSAKPTLVEGVDGVAHLLTGAAPQRAGYCRGAFTPVAGEDDLGSAHDESVFGA
jgi:hypothetical protein